MEKVSLCTFCEDQKLIKCPCCDGLGIADFGKLSFLPIGLAIGCLECEGKGSIPCPKCGAEA